MWWVAIVAQPKHVVLTVKNREGFDRAYVSWFKECFTKLRRSKFARFWNGGMFSLEVTNEGKGWHLHLHALIDAKWIDAQELAVKWASIVGQDFAIVKVLDVRNKSYLHEVSKYAVKGSDLAKWSTAELVCYLSAMDGVRSFGTFGSLFKRQSEFVEWREAMLATKNACPCGCTHFKYFSESEWSWECHVTGSRPPPAVAIVEPPQQPELQIDVAFDRVFEAIAR